MKDSRLIIQITGKLVVGGAHEVVTNEKAVKVTSTGVLSVPMYLTIESSFEDVKCEMAKMLTV